jgi:exonuclease SbcC
MIPLRLSLKNFLCYRENVPTLDFSGIHVACLCGPNGHGKSALLDAITWCLWGKARARTHDDLISYGADESRVELDFLARGTEYRVIRSHSRSGGRRRQGVTDVQLQVLGASGHQPITGNQVRDTQARIDQIVGMDYDTFINSAFLLQGRADEFTTKIPSERKAVLAKILGLESYDRLQERAKVRLEQSRASADGLEGSLSLMRQQAEAIGDVSSELAEAGRRLDELNQRLEERRLETDELGRRVADLERTRLAGEELQGQMRRLHTELGHLESALAGGKERVQQYQALLQQAGAILQGVGQLQEARHRLETQEGARLRYDQLDRERTPLRRSVDGARAKLEAQVEQLRRTAEGELPDRAESGTRLLAELQETRRRLAGLEEEERGIAEQRQLHQSLATRIGETQAAAERYKVEGQELRAKLDLLNPPEADDHREAVCPLCNTPLGEDGCGRLAKTFQTEIDDKRELYRQNAAQLRSLEAQRSALERELPRREQALARTQRDSEVKVKELELGIEDSQRAQRELEQAKAQLASALASLASGDFAADQCAQLKDLERRIEAVGYDEKARRESYSRMQQLQPFEERRRQLSDAEARLPQEEKSLSQTGEMLQRRRSELNGLEDRHRVDQEAVAALPQWQARLKEAQSQLVGLETRRQEAAARCGYLQGQLERLEGLRRDIDAGAVRVSDLREGQGIFQELATAFGRQGVQAMLIETVVPMIEEEANLLMGRMTDNRMHVKLETQRERRSGRGDPIETLQIYVSDELGPRSYEMYSGGEAFRVNLALRIALSKVLARRMGAPLPTLFIDEGFGTQDAAGRERILDVISAIQDDFEKIIVITHLDDLKDVFPVRIEVQKQDSGSTFWLS